jgi:thioesterase domain-containing protein
MNELTAELQSIWRREIPLAVAMAIELTVRAALAPNTNVHGTAFAGSLYSICALAGWGALWLQFRARNIAADIVLAEGHIRYRKAVAEQIVCRCRFDPDLQIPNLEQLVRTGSGLFPLTCTVIADTRRAVRFEGEYAVKHDMTAGKAAGKSPVAEPTSASTDQVAAATSQTPSQIMRSDT